MYGGEQAVNNIRKHLISFDETLEEVCSVVLDEPRFPIWTGSSNKGCHHYGKGGLAQHVSEVLDLAILNNNYFWKLNKHINQFDLICAVIFHDIGKVYDYEPINEDYSEWKTTEHKYQIHHINRSALIWSEACDGVLGDEDRKDRVLHAILSHHCLPEWGSPVSPKTELAWMLHLADSMSARMDDCRKEI